KTECALTMTPITSRHVTAPTSPTQPKRFASHQAVGRAARASVWSAGACTCIAFAQAKGARRLRRFRGGQPWLCSKCQGRGIVPTLKRPKGRAPAAFGVGTNTGASTLRSRPCYGARVLLLLARQKKASVPPDVRQPVGLRDCASELAHSNHCRTAN